MLVPTAVAAAENVRGGLAEARPSCFYVSLGSPELDSSGLTEYGDAPRGGAWLTHGRDCCKCRGIKEVLKQKTNSAVGRVSTVSFYGYSGDIRGISCGCSLQTAQAKKAY